jgi:predicted GIY-YIG superfamily endonuclease
MVKTKAQLACEAARYWNEYVGRHGGSRKGYRTDLSPEITERGDTRNLLGKRFGVSGNYVHEARQLYLKDYERFLRVEAGEESLPTRKPKKKQNKGNASFALYRAYDANNELLYVGMTWKVGERMAQHASTSDWWDEFTTMTVDRSFETYEELSQAELIAIDRELPKYNLR